MTTLLDDLKAVNAYEEPAAPRVLTIDIETSPIRAYVWSLFKPVIAPNQIIEPTRVLSVAAKWLHEKKTRFYAEWLDENFLDDVWHLFDEADVLVTFNGKRFDNLHLQREWLQRGLGKPSPWQDVDLYEQSKRQFRFASNRLGYITDQLGLPTKLQTSGFDLWKGVLAGEQKSLAQFRKYNEQDVVITEQLFVLLQQWLRTPHIGQWTHNMFGCHVCGSGNLAFDGFIHGPAITYPKALCGSCGALNKLMRSGQTRAV